MELSRGTAYGLGFSQVAVTLAVILYFPAVPGKLFTVTVGNGTAPLAAREVREHPLTLAFPLLVCSLLAVLFTTNTLQMFEDSTGGMDYMSDTMEHVAMWDLIFWVYCLLTHVLWALLLTSPVDAYALWLGTCLLVYFLHKACSPKGRQVNLTQENVNILGYCVGAAILALQIPDDRQNLGVCLACVVILDYFLGIGHTWDREATLETITNCRLFYTCAVSFGLITLYGMWHDM